MKERSIPTPGLRRRWAELALIFGVGPALLSLGPRWSVLPGILIGCAICLGLGLRDPELRRVRLVDTAGARRGLPRVLARAALVWAGLLLIAAIRDHGGLFAFPRAHPVVWLVFVVAYPLLSVYPQELMYRTFFFHRYAGLFRGPRQVVLANTLLFGWAHIVIHNLAALLLATAGGLLFATTYQRSRSTLLVAVEHALYGDFLFSVGLGGLFLTGTRLIMALGR